MTNGTKGAPAPRGRGSSMRELGPKTAALVLIAATVIVGAVGYVVLSAVSAESTNTANTCTAAGSTHCPPPSASTTARPSAGDALDPARR
jgi:hypothetical protein